MRTLPRFLPLLAALAGICLPFVTPAFGTVNIEYVIVGNAGNAADARVASDSTTGYGAVGYAYRIGKYEVTNSQYCEFLNAKGESNNAGIYNSGMSSSGIIQHGTSGSFTYNVTSGLENRPAVYVSWFDAARFCNWLGNGQGNGSMETGAYTLNGATSGNITVNPGATVHIPSEDEWYKAAYYQATTAEYNGGPFLMGVDGAMNYNNYLGRSTDVGYYSGYPSFYGTFDQGGNAQEWNDAVSGPYRGVRGGGYADSVYSIGAWRRSFNTPYDEASTRGFRVASLPSSVSTLSGMAISTGTLSPAFATGTTGYLAVMPAATTGISVTPTVTDPTATIKVNGISVASGTTSTMIAVVDGQAIPTVVTAQDGSTTTYSITIAISGYDAWKARGFTKPADLDDPEVSGEMAAPANDGIVNLMKHALGLPPLTCGTSGMPTVSQQDGYLTLTYRKSKTATDVTYTVLSTDALSGEAWAPATEVVSQADQGDHWLVTVRDIVPYAGQARRFMRLQVAK